MSIAHDVCTPSIPSEFTPCTKMTMHGIGRSTGTSVVPPPGTHIDSAANWGRDFPWFVFIIIPLIIIVTILSAGRYRRFQTSYV